MKKSMNKNSIYKTDVPQIGFLRAVIIILVNFLTLTYLPRFVDSRFNYVLIAAGIMSISFVLSAYRFSSGEKIFTKWFFIKLLATFLLISFILFIVMYQM